MRLREFRRAGHWPTLLCAFLYFDLSFMVWMLMGALGAFIAEALHLNAAEKGFLVAVPVLAGALLRVVLGSASDRWGAKRVGITGMLLTCVPLVWGATAMHSFSEALAVGALLGVAGASFAVALPLASRWYPPEHQGLAMGIAGAGNSGTVLAALFAPRLAESIGWHAVFGYALLPLLIVLVVFAIFAREPLRSTTRSRSPRELLRIPDAWRLNAFYAVTFGGFVGLASFLPMFFVDQYGSARVTAGSWAAACVFAGSFLRPVGGLAADRFGGARVLSFLYVLVAGLAVAASFLLPLPMELCLLVVMMGSLGMGNGAVFQLVGQRFPKDVGVATGIVGAAGGIGGFLLPSLLGLMKQLTGSYGTGLLLFAAAAASAALALMVVQHEWRHAPQVGFGLGSSEA